MLRPLRLALHLAIVIFSTGLSAETAKAQDPVQVDPEHYKVLFEDKAVRVLRYDDTPGHFVPKHSHPQYVVYALAPALRKFFAGDCSNRKVKPVQIQSGIPIVKQPVTHCELNAGNADDHLLIFEFKNPATAKQKARALRRSYRSLLARKLP